MPSQKFGSESPRRPKVRAARSRAPFGRSAEQIRSYGWTGDADMFLPAFQFGPFTTPSTDLVE